MALPEGKEDLGIQLSDLSAKLSAALQREKELREAKDGAYRERNQCVSALAKMALGLGYRAGVSRHVDKPGEDWDNDWRTVVFIDLPTGQVSWHMHDSDRPLLYVLPHYEGEFDGHDTPEKYRRLAALTPPNMKGTEDGDRPNNADPGNGSDSDVGVCQVAEEAVAHQEGEGDLSWKQLAWGAEYVLALCAQAYHTNTPVPIDRVEEIRTKILSKMHPGQVIPEPDPEAPQTEAKPSAEEMERQSVDDHHYFDSGYEVLDVTRRKGDATKNDDGGSRDFSGCPDGDSTGVSGNPKLPGTMTELEGLLGEYRREAALQDSIGSDEECDDSERKLLSIHNRIRSLVERLEKEVMGANMNFLKSELRCDELEAQLSIANERLKECQKCLQDACRATISTCPKCGKEDAHLSVSSSSICRRCEKSTAIRKAVIEELKGILGTGTLWFASTNETWWITVATLEARIAQLEEEDGRGNQFNSGCSTEPVNPRSSSGAGERMDRPERAVSQSVARTGYEGASLDELLTVPLSLRQANSFLTELRRRLEAGEAAQAKLSMIFPEDFSNDT